ncbi:MAG: hypothetical protein JJE22_03585 [Bacteroidia bacterium]|nr:hypothetical protein [Bacteroidia bacterium]
MSYRGDEITGGDPNYPQKGVQRGNPNNKDFYYFTGLHLTFKFGAGNGSSGSNYGSRGRSSRYGCPANPQ